MAVVSRRDVDQLDPLHLFPHAPSELLGRVDWGTIQNHNDWRVGATVDRCCDGLKHFHHGLGIAPVAFAAVQVMFAGMSTAGMAFFVFPVKTICPMICPANMGQATQSVTCLLASCKNFTRSPPEVAQPRDRNGMTRIDVWSKLTMRLSETPCCKPKDAAQTSFVGLLLSCNCRQSPPLKIRL